jgi:hypothetical protein
MPRRNSKRRSKRSMKGGFLDLTNLGSSLTQGASSLTQGAYNLFEKAKQATSGTTSTSYSAPQQSTYTPTLPSTGGRTRRRRRHMKGGFHDNTPTTGLAVHAASFSGPTAQPHKWVGGKTRRHKKKSRRSSNRRYKRH